MTWGPCHSIVSGGNQTTDDRADSWIVLTSSPAPSSNTENLACVSGRGQDRECGAGSILSSLLDGAPERMSADLSEDMHMSEV